jgi:hypothetical protein
VVPITNRKIYHFTDFGNIPKIVEAGGLHCDAHMVDHCLGFTECAEVGIKSARRAKPVPVEPYGTVGDYVPFYYAPRSPMMSSITHGKVPGYTNSKNLVYLVSDLDAVHAADLVWVCTDGNARSGLTQFFNTWADLGANTDWQVIRTRMWSNTETDGDRRRRRMAEFLVHKFFPEELVSAIFVHNNKMALKIRSTVPSDIPVKINSDMYL